ncbi:gluconolaconase [Streptomyces sp. MUSC 14]|uniref:gluconolaconase n=1 Tax=Streptomyces sp. MUSC 14 TaxID=1354889 RepID=UPI0008F5685C|nr:gluconolaconase [Streptomyces sp. MUSC 14]OIJ97488.1 gluconolaconase [Streptomyces sp. MUSC 14]
MGGPTKNNVSTTHLGERFVRHPLTKRNLEELGIAGKAAAILERDKEKLKRKAEKKAKDGSDRYVSPTGFSLNKGRFDFPEEGTAHDLGWIAYMTVGVPLVEERGDIAQPPPDVIAKQTYVNRTDPVPTDWSHTVEFSISNTISWSLQGQVQLTFGAKVTASLQQQLQKSMALNQSQKTTLKNSKDNQGVDTESQSQTTSTSTATSTATGTGELSAQLMLGITASVSGSLTTSFKTSSTLSGKVGSRVDVLATQRRQVRRFDYEYPISFGGWVALYYPEPVEVKETRPSGPQAMEPKYSRVLAWKLGETGTVAEAFDLTDEGKPFLQKGEAEVVSTLAGVHEIFELENLNFDLEQHPLHKGKGKEQERPKEAPSVRATGLGRSYGLALDEPNNKAYVADRNGRLYEVDLASDLRSGNWREVASGLGDIVDVALDLSKKVAYVTDYSGGRLCKVKNLFDGSKAVEVVEVAKVPYVYGLALDGSDRAYVTDYNNGQLIAVNLKDELENGEARTKPVIGGMAYASGVALDRDGRRAYVGRYVSGPLYEVDLNPPSGAAKSEVATFSASTRVALDGKGRAYVSDHAGDCLHEVDLNEKTKGLQRVVATGLGDACGVGPHSRAGKIYVSNMSGQLWEIPDVLPGAPETS